MLPRQPAQDIVRNIWVSPARVAQNNRETRFPDAVGVQNGKELVKYGTG